MQLVTMNEVHIDMEPGDATHYTLVYGLITMPWQRDKQLFLAFGDGDRNGNWVIMPANSTSSFKYFTEYFGQSDHTAWLAFYILHHILGTTPAWDDYYARIKNLKPNWLDTVLTIKQLTEGESHDLSTSGSS